MRRRSRSCSASLDADATGAAPVSFADYEQVRDWVLECADRLDVPVVQVERALYELSRAVPSEEDRTWRRYAEDVAAQLPR